jgi:hypothetical protein
MKNFNMEFFLLIEQAINNINHDYGYKIENMPENIKAYYEASIEIWDSMKIEYDKIIRKYT